MPATAITLTNPGGESANITGWTSNVFSLDFWVDPVQFHSGSYSLRIDDDEFNGFYQDHTLTAPEILLADAGTMIIHGSVWQKSYTSGDAGHFYMQFLDASGILISNTPSSSGYVAYTSWTQLERYTMVPVGTRTIRIGVFNYFARIYWDDFVLEYSTNAADFPDATEIDVFQYGAYALAAQPADSAAFRQLGVNIVGQAEEVSGLHDVHFQQVGVYALVRPHAERQDLTAWTFKQDDHEFYVLQLNSLDTLVFDKLTGQWTDWISPDYNHWRGADGCNWEGIAVCCDTRSGKLWQIDPEGRLDYEDTPIVSTIVGGFTERMRAFKPVYMAELAISEGQPPAVTEGSVGISLRTGDGQGNWYSHGEILGEDTGENMTVRWYGLGLAAPSGMVFEITDTGYARRIDGLNIEIGE